MKVGGKRQAKPRENGGRERRGGMGKGLEGKVSVLRCLNGKEAVSGRVGSGGKAVLSEISNGVAGGGRLAVRLVNSERSVVMDEGVRPLPYLWRAHLRALSRASSLKVLRVKGKSFWILP